MDLVLLGLSHRTASVSARGSLATWLGGDLASWLVRARDLADVAELAVLATCHRVEIYAVAADPSEAETRLRGMIAGAHASGPASSDEIYVLSGLDAVAHLCQVACGLDSMIVGESEIAGQVRRAAALARDAGTMGPYLEAAIAGALAASGRARSQTRIAHGVLSAASASVALATGELGSLAGRTLLVIGAGQTGRAALARAARAPHGPLIVASRSEKHAGEAASDTGATAAMLSEVPDLLGAADAVIIAVHMPGVLIDRAMCERAMRSRTGRRLLLIDLSVPRASTADVALVEGVDVRTVDDLGDIARASAAQRAAEIPLVEAIAGDESRRAYRRIAARRRRAVQA
ncbi:MAG: glutamyl-tRNA reductase [Acidobacteriota bacterium]